MSVPRTFCRSSSRASRTPCTLPKVWISSLRRRGPTPASSSRRLCSVRGERRARRRGAARRGGGGAARAMAGDGETVGLVADLLEQPQAGIVPPEPERLRHAGDVDLL